MTLVDLRSACAPRHTVDEGMRTVREREDDC
jgi:hypothetical protein